MLAEYEVEHLGVFSLGVSWHPQVLTDQLTLSQPGGRGNYAHQINTTDTPGFSDLPTALALTNVKLNRQRRKSRKSNFLCDMGAGDIVQKCGAIASFSNRNSFLSNKEIPAPGYQALAD